MRIAICDDQREVRELFEERIQRLYPEAELLLFSSGEQLLDSKKAPDILLLDIQMPGKNGMDTARELRKKNKNTILIFVTALEEFVFQAFDVGAFHYLVKPFHEKKFAEVLMRAAAQSEENKKREAVNSKKEKPGLVITTKGRHITVDFDEIIFAEVFDRKVILHLLDSDIEYYGKMKELQEQAGDEFFRPHRAYLVNFNYIRKYDAATIELEKGQALMAKQNYREFVRRYLRFVQKKGKGQEKNNQ